MAEGRGERVGQAYYELSLDVTQLEKKLSEQDKKLDAFLRNQARQAASGGQASGSSLGNAFGSAMDRAMAHAETKVGKRLSSIQQSASSAGNALTIGLTLPLGLAVKGALEATVAMESLEQMLVVTMGSAAAAGAEMEKLKELAKLPGIDLKQAVGLSVSLQQIGIGADEARSVMREFSNEMSKFGGGAVEFERMRLNLQQIAGMGKLTGDELREVGAIIPSIRAKLKTLYGTDDTQELAKKGLTGIQFIRDMTTELAKEARAPVDTLKVEIENLRQEFMQLQDEAGQAFVPFLRVVMDELGPAIRDATGWFKDLSDEQKKQVVLWTGIALAAGPAAKSIGAVVSLTQGVLALRAALAGTAVAGAAASASVAGTGAAAAGAAASTGLLAAAMNPVGITAIAITAAVVGLKLAYDHVASEGERYIANMKRQEKVDLDAAIAKERNVKTARPLIEEYQRLTTATDLTGKQQSRLNEILNELAAIAPDVIKGYDDQGRATGIYEDAIRKLGLAAEATRDKLRLMAKGAFEAETAGVLSAKAKAEERVESLELALRNLQDRWSVRKDPRVTPETLKAMDAEMSQIRKDLAQARLDLGKLMKASSEAAQRGRDAAGAVMHPKPDKPPVRPPLNDGDRNNKAGKAAGVDPDEAARLLVLAVAKGITTPKGEASCAYFASQLIEQVTKGAVDIPGKSGIGGANALREHIQKLGFSQVDAKKARPGDLVFMHGPQYGAMKGFTHNGRKGGWHVEAALGNGRMVGSSGGKLKSPSSIPSGALVYAMPEALRSRISPSMTPGGDAMFEAYKDNQRLAQDVLDIEKQIQQLRLKSAETAIGDLIAMEKFGVLYRDLANQGQKAVVNRTISLKNEEAKIEAEKAAKAQSAGVFFDQWNARVDGRRSRNLELEAAKKIQQDLNDQVAEITRGYEEVLGIRQAMTQVEQFLARLTKEQLSLLNPIKLEEMKRLEAQVKLREEMDKATAASEESSRKSGAAFAAWMQPFKDLTEKAREFREELLGLSEAEKRTAELIRGGMTQGTAEFLSGQESALARAKAHYDEIKSLSDNAAASVGRALADGIFKGPKAALDSLADAFRSTVGQMLQEALMASLRPEFEKLFGLAGAKSKGVDASFGVAGLNAALGVAAIFGGGGKIPGRASGGPVSAGSMYQVGENGPELFVPGVHGNIMSNPATRRALAGQGQQNITVNVTINAPSDASASPAFAANVQQAVADGVRSALRQAQRRGG